nr:MAG TPA: hypothetical protein [Caudoviricetes sp.]
MMNLSTNKVKKIKKNIFFAKTVDNVIKMS